MPTAIPISSTTSVVACPTGTQWPGMASSASAVITEVAASSSGMAAAISAPNTTTSRPSVIGIEVSSAFRKSAETSPLMARSPLASPASAINRPRWRAWAAATAFRSGTTAWSMVPEFPGMVNVTRTLRPSAETSDLFPGLSGERMSTAARGRSRRAAATWLVAWRSSGSAAKVRPGDRDWISTLSAGGEVTFSRFRVCSACPDWPASYDGTFVDETKRPPTKTAATRSSQPITAVFRCVALHPAMRSTTAPRGRSAGCSAVSGRAELNDWRMVPSLTDAALLLSTGTKCRALLTAGGQPGSPLTGCARPPGAGIGRTQDSPPRSAESSKWRRDDLSFESAVPLGRGGVAVVAQATPLVGRDADLSQLVTALAQASEGAGSMVLVSGEAGIGKTRVCAEVRRWHRQRGGRVLLGRAAPQEASIPYA